MPDSIAQLQQRFETIRDERRTAANTAERIGEAFLAILPWLGQFLRKDQAETVQYLLTMLGGAVVGDNAIQLNADGSITCGNINVSLQTILNNLQFSGILKSEGATVGDNPTGIHMDASTGTISTENLQVNGWMMVAKLIYNMLQVMEQDYVFGGGGDIESVVNNGDGTYTLYFHKEKEGRHISFADYDILMGKVDEQQEVGGSYMYWTSWMRVCENGIVLNDGMNPDTARVELWDDNMVPAGTNFAPKEMMTVAKRGNTQTAARQSFWELSTTDKRITFYWNVDQPILRADNYALCFGILPTILDTAGVLPDTRDPLKPSLYIDTIFYEHAHHIYYPSRIVKEDRGEWSSTPTTTYTGPDGTYQGETYEQGGTISEPYHFESFSRNMWLTYRLSPGNQSLTDAQLLQKMEKEWHIDKETSRVWRYGALWECLVDETANAPEIGCTDWALIQQPAMELKITITKRWLRTKDFQPAGRVATTLSFIFPFGGYDLTSQFLQSECVWTRISYGADTDATLAAADAAWNQAHRYGDLSLNITSNDLPSNWASVKEVSFRLTITRNGQTVAARSFNLH